MSDVRIPQDKLGQTIQVGDIVVCGHSLGRSAGLAIAKILSIQFNKMYGRIESWTIKTISIDDHWDHREPRLNSRIGVRMYPNRMLKLDRNSIPSAVVHMLDSYEVEEE